MFNMHSYQKIIEGSAAEVKELKSLENIDKMEGKNHQHMENSESEEIDAKDNCWVCQGWR